MTQSHTNQEKYRQFRIRTENTAILLLAVFSLFLFVLTFFPLSRLSQHMQASIEMGRMVQRAFSMILFFFPSSYGNGNAMPGFLPWESLS